MLKIARISLLIPILLLGTLVTPNVIHLARATTGEVCLADTSADTSAAPCPSSPPYFNGTRGQQIRIGVFLQASDSLNGFDISLAANNTILVPVGADLTGTLLPGTPAVIIECIQGILVHGAVCGANDNITTLHLAVTGGLGQLTTAPSTGLLFTAVYNVTGTTGSNGISVTFATGCSGSSVSGDICVTIPNGTTTPDPELVQDGTFDNSNLDTTTTSVACLPIFVPVNNPTTCTAIVTDIHGSLTSPTGTVLFTSDSPGSFAPIAGCSLSTISARAASCQDSYTPNALASGTHTITSSYKGDSTHGLSVSQNSVTVTPVTEPDFSIISDTGSLVVSVGMIATSLIHVSTVNGFEGNVSLALSVTPAAGLSCSVSPSLVFVPGISSLSCIGNLQGAYGVTVIATSGSLIRGTIVTINVLSQAPNVGIVCIAGVDAQACPISAPVLAGPSPGIMSQFTVAVLVNSSQALNGFDITLLTNRSILVPSAVAAGSLLTNVHEIVKCIGGVNKLGSTLCPSTNNSSTIEYAVVGDVTDQPATGVLFTAMYNITGNTRSSPIIFQTGCTNTSVPGSVCVSITQGTPVSVPEIAQTAKFSNLPYFDIVPSARIVQVSRGDTDAVEFVAVSSVNGFGGTSGATVELSTSVYPAVALSPLPLFSVLPSSVTVAIGSDGLAGLTITVPDTTPPGSYILNLTGTSPGMPPNSVTIRLIVPVPDISMAVNPKHLFFSATYSGTSLITISSIGNFQGNVTISLTFPSQIHATLSDQETSQTIMLTSKGSNTTALTVSSTIAGDYFLNITATSGSLVHISTITIVVMDFRMEANHGPPRGPLIIVNGTSNTEFILVTATDLFYNATVTIGPISIYQVQSNGTAPSNGISVGCDPTQLSIVSYVQAYRIVEGSNSTNCSVTGYAIGNYTVTVAATSGSGFHVSSHSVSFQVTVVTVMPPPPPTFHISTNSTLGAITAGSNATLTITLSSINGFAGTITLTTPVRLPTAILNPTSVVLSSGGTVTSVLLLATTRTTSAGIYFVPVFGHSGNLTQVLGMYVQVLPPADTPPVASFVVSPSSSIVGQNVSFDGSGSVDSDGIVVSWSWSFGDGSFTTGEFVSHFYNVPGNYNVTLTVTDNAGLSSSTSSTVSVISQPAHDVAIVLVNPQPKVAVSTQTVYVQVQLANNGLDNENVSLTVYANGQPVQTLAGLFVPPCIPTPYNFCGYRDYFLIPWDTGRVAPGNYTLSASVSLAPGEVDPTPSDNSLADGTVTVLPAPIITLSPNSGPDGTKVQVQATGYPGGEQYGYPFVGYIEINFDNMTVGFILSHNGSFTFTFDAPLSQAGPHGVFAFDQNSGAHASATFTVQPPPNNNLVVTIDTGTVYFPGDKVVVYILTTLNGVPTGPSDVQLTVTLFFSNGTSRSMTTASLGSGLFETVYNVPTTGPLGTYAIVAKAHMTGPLDASSLATFEVKLSWLTSNKNTIMTVGTLAGVIGLVGVAWKKGYLWRKDEPAQFFD